MNTGYKGKQHEIFAYNGGLFAPDEVLDNIKIDDTLLHEHSVRLSDYDFMSEVSVNILGHIFEHSLNDIEQIQNELAGIEIDKSKTKRKKDGVFYTPKYITKYIVDNTIGKLCKEKKEELKIIEEDYNKDPKGRKKATIKKLNAQLDKYRDWLLQVTICDPACGSGAFLNQALEFLITEHGYIDELVHNLFGDSIPFPNIENAILENNLYGVDINEESIEIAKLSLWLRTAQKGRKLTSLNNNIKCGNSLIDDKEVAGDKAFHWESEFPEVFNQGGFDIVIGNPPYVICQPSNTLGIVLDFYKTYKVASYKIDLFHLFFEKSISILKNKGSLGFITPNTFLNNKYIKPLRQLILETTSINYLINYKDPIFADAGVDVATIICSKAKTDNNVISVYEVQKGNLFDLGKKKQSDWEEDKEKIFNIRKEFEVKFHNCTTLSKICNSYFGIQAYDRKSSISEQKLNENYLPIIDGGDIKSFSIAKPKLYFNFLPENIKSGGNKETYFEKRIVISQIGLTPIVGICESGILASNTLYNINLKNNDYQLFYILCILNSKLIKSYWGANYADGKKLFPKIKGFQLKELPIRIVETKKQMEFRGIAEEMLILNDRLYTGKLKFTQLALRRFKLNKTSKKLNDWELFEFEVFVNELKKKKVKLSLSEEAEWQEYFEAEKAKALEIKHQIDQTDKEIDQMVYALYELTPEEIEIVERSLW